MVLTEKQRLLIGLAIVVVLLAVIGVLIWRDRIRIGEAREEIAGLDAKIAMHEKTTARKPKLRADLLKEKRREPYRTRVLPDSPEAEQFLWMLKQKRAEAQVQILSTMRSETSPGKAKAVGSCRPHGWTLTLVGSFFNLVRFINLLESQSRFVRVESFTLAPGGAGAEARKTMKMTLALTAFSYAPATAAAKKKK